MMMEYGREEYLRDVRSILQSIYDVYFDRQRKNIFGCRSWKEFYHLQHGSYKLYIHEDCKLSDLLYVAGKDLADDSTNLRLVALSHMVTLYDNPGRNRYGKIEENLDEFLYCDHKYNYDLYPWDLIAESSREKEIRAQFTYNVKRDPRAQQILRAAVDSYSGFTYWNSYKGRSERMLTPTLSSSFRRKSRNYKPLLQLVQGKRVVLERDG